MKIALHVLAAPYSDQSNLTAYRFAKAALKQGHCIPRVFFSGDGVLTGNQLSTPPQDEPDLNSLWVELAEQHDIELILCVSAALKRGILDQTEADRYDKPHAITQSPFIISGLGQLVEAAIEYDRLVTFGVHH